MSPFPTFEQGQTQRWVMPCPMGCEQVLADEVRALGIEVGEVRPTAVLARGTLQDGYRLCLWSRVASRVLLPLVQWQGNDAETMYASLRAQPWWEVFDAEQTFAIAYSQASSRQTPALFWVQRAKDAIVDAFRDHNGERPSIDKQAPAIRFHLHIGDAGGELGLDFSGSGHRRGYRAGGGAAPLKENLAAAILSLAGWPGVAHEGFALLDPTCGSGTFLVEAALMASNCAPGLLRERFGFEAWSGHDALVFEAERQTATAARKSEIEATIIGCDASEAALEEARANIARAGVSDLIVLYKQRLKDLEKPSERGLFICNPPYGHRLGDDSALFLFYQALGDLLKRRFGNWNAYVFAARGPNLKHLGLRPTQRHTLYNGAIECRLLGFPILESRDDAPSPGWRKASPQAGMFVNRVRKNERKLKRWARRESIDCYRVYDCEIPEYRVAVDRYGERAIVHVKPRRYKDETLAQRRVQDVLLSLPEALGIQPHDIAVRVRHKHSEGDQYTRLASNEDAFVVKEGELRFIVDLEDRLDTGLFIDHRKVRSWAMNNLRNKRVLNLFAYTCSVSVAAARGGARMVTSVDLSNTYLDWGRRNFVENGLDESAHSFIRSDANDWLRGGRDTFDWIFLNPPTFSRSKKTKGELSLHRDHPQLIDAAMRRVEREGELLFTTHARDFQLADRIASHYAVRTIPELVPPDFARSPFAAFAIKHRR